VKIRALQRAVAAAEQDAQQARTQLASHASSLRTRVIRWAPRVLVGGGAMAGFWLDGQGAPNASAGSDGSAQATNEKSATETSTGEGQPAPAHNARTFGIAGRLSMALSILQLIEHLRPLIAEASVAGKASSTAPPEVRQSDLFEP